MTKECFKMLIKSISFTSSEQFHSQKREKKVLLSLCYRKDLKKLFAVLFTHQKLSALKKRLNKKTDIKRHSC